MYVRGSCQGLIVRTGIVITNKRPRRWW